MAAKEDLGEGLSNGEQSPFVKLISAEGHEFFVDRKCALVSGTIRSMLQSQFAESSGEIRFPEIPGVVLERVVQYLYYKVRYSNTNQRVPAFDIEPDLALELLVASNYLDC